MTDVKASPATIRAVATALGRARLFDDKLGGSDEGRIAAWAEAVEPHALSQADMLQAVTDFYSSNDGGRTMQVSDLIRHARNLRRDRAQAESDAERQAREDMLDRRDELLAITQDVGKCLSSTKPMPRPKANPLLVRCPWCHASVNVRCSVPRTNETLNGWHPSRVEAAEEAAS